MAVLVARPAVPLYLGGYPSREASMTEGTGAVAYAVTSGAYSDYSVHAIFTTEAAAKQYIADIAKVRVQHFIGTEIVTGEGGWRTYGDDFDIEEFPLNPVAPKVESGAWRVIVAANGKVYGATWEANVSPTKPAERRPHSSEGEVQGYGPTPEHARRSAEEFRRVLLTTPIPAHAP